MKDTKKPPRTGFAVESGSLADLKERKESF